MTYVTEFSNNSGVICNDKANPKGYRKRMRRGFPVSTFLRLGHYWHAKTLTLAPRARRCDALALL
ncbi:MAG TPA: hypothetical protein VFT44_11135 [Pyrinomonadaceae bacterium]|nr:hypothetical protein [Pyrinomonadaceae bacterium]